jgi:DUF971 family protein
MHPQQIKVDSATRELQIRWDDGSHSTISLKILRDECPCAGCKGEVLFGKVYKPAPLSVFQEGMYELAALKPVGQYAVQAVWKDGHDTGIYSWEYLRALSES